MYCKEELNKNADFHKELENDPFNQDPSVELDLERTLKEKPALDKIYSYEYKISELEFPTDENDLHSENLNVNLENVKK
jgi:hypothetical protein